MIIITIIQLLIVNNIKFADYVSTYKFKLPKLAFSFIANHNFDYAELLIGYIRIVHQLQEII